MMLNIYYQGIHKYNIYKIINNEKYFLEIVTFIIEICKTNVQILMFIWSVYIFD